MNKIVEDMVKESNTLNDIQKYYYGLMESEEFKSFPFSEQNDIKREAALYNEIYNVLLRRLGRIFLKKK